MHWSVGQFLVRDEGMGKSLSVSRVLGLSGCVGVLVVNVSRYMVGMWLRVWIVESAL